MAVNSRILLVEKDELRQKIIINTLDFIDIDVEVVSEIRSRSSFDGFECLILSADGEGAHQAHLQLELIQKIDSTLPVLILTDEKHLTQVKSLFQKSAFDFLAYPLKYSKVSDVLHRAQLFRLNDKSASAGKTLDLFRSLVGSSRSIVKVRELIDQVAPSDATVLILGETGTGKEVVARTLHYHSERRKQPFVPVNCGAIPSELLESELFGHEKGAFTGAISSRQGRFELAEGGTLFLDEIGEMSLPMQVKLLRVLQEKTFERVGSNTSVYANVRIVAATHRNLEELIEQGKFREDLYYRLNVFPIEMPPLRGRTEDIPLLINELVSRVENEKRGSVRLTAAAVGALCQYRWPGNVRELSNLMERLVIMHPYGVVDVYELPDKFLLTATRQEGSESGGLLEGNQAVYESAGGSALVSPQALPNEGLDLREHLSNLERSLIKTALEDAEGVVAHAAKRLKMRRTTLVEKMRKYALHRGEVVAEL